VYKISRQKNGINDSALEIKDLSILKICIMITMGIIALYIGGKWTVDGAVSLAKAAGISEYVISLTIVAVGTSLPELITSIVSIQKKDVDLAVGNIVGSNILNIFLILGISAIINPIKIPLYGIADLIILLSVTLVLFLCMFVGKKHELERWQGGLFLVFYAAYVYYLFARG